MVVKILKYKFGKFWYGPHACVAYMLTDYVIVYREEILVEGIARIYIKEVFIRYRVLSKVILDRDLRFIVVF